MGVSNTEEVIKTMKKTNFSRALVKSRVLSTELELQRGRKSQGKNWRDRCHMAGEKLAACPGSQSREERSH